MTKFSDNDSPSLLFTEQGSTPSTPAASHQRLFVRSSDHLLCFVNSSGTVTPVGSGLSDPMTTRGDIIVRNASNVTARLAIGSSGKVLSSDGTDVSWQTPSGGGSLTLLSSTVLGSPAADITVTGISGSYKDLYLVCKARGANSTDIQVLRMRLGNGSIDTGSNYAYVKQYGGSLGSGTDNNSADSFANIGAMTAATSPSGAFGETTVEILNYVSASHWKTYLARHFQQGTGNIGSYSGGSWKNTSAAIDQVRVYADVGNLDTGSALWIYGRG